MIGYVTIGTSDLDAAAAFYDALILGIGGRGLFRSPNSRVYVGAGGSLLSVRKPYDKRPASVGNGSMFGIPVESNALVETAHRLALEGGGTCEGPPGYRTPTMYIAYFRDLDGNKLAAYHMAAPEDFARDAHAMVGALVD